MQKNILITGASSGIGAALAKCYAITENHTHLILLARNTEKLEQVAKACEATNITVDIHSVDITQTEAVRTLVKNIDDKTPIDLVICNAGVTSIIPRSSEPESWDAIENVINTNIYGVLATINPLIDSFKKRRKGHIAIVSSLAAHYGMPISPVYCASKSAVKGYAQALRGWLKSEGVAVTVIYPGFVKSGLSDQFHSEKPFMVTPEKAADIIVRGLDKRKATISFPFPLNLSLWALGLLPESLADKVMSLLYGVNKSGVNNKSNKH